MSTVENTVLPKLTNHLHIICIYACVSIYVCIGFMYICFLLLASKTTTMIFYTWTLVVTVIQNHTIMTLSSHVQRTWHSNGFHSAGSLGLLEQRWFLRWIKSRPFTPGLYCRGDLEENTVHSHGCQFGEPELGGKRIAVRLAVRNTSCSHYLQ